MKKKVKKYLRYLDFQNNYPRFTLGTLIVILCCSFLIIAATFTLFLPGYVLIPEKLVTDPASFFSSSPSFKQFSSYFSYIPQVPVVLFIGALLGPRFGVMSVLIYILAGLLGYPVFSMGGGWHYALNPSFGYIIGFIFGAYFIGKRLENNISNISIFLSSLFGVFIIHAIGICFLMISLFFNKEQAPSILSYIWLFTGIQVIYDVAISIIAVSLARPARAILWIAMS